MGKSFKETILSPFKEDIFVAPELDIPISTIKIPSLLVCTIIIFISFMIISAGTIFCWVHNSPFIGAKYQNDKVVPVIFADNMSWQFGGEGFIASLVYAMTALSFMAAYYVFKHPNSNKSDPIIAAVMVFSWTSPIWVILTLMTFRCKVPHYFPRPFP